jgi:MFS family permease
MEGDAKQTTEQLQAQIQPGQEKPELPTEYGVYSVFTIGQKRWIIFLVAFAGWFSTLSSFIFFPAIPSMARDLRTSVEHINLTVTSYLIVSGVVPSIVGDSADMAGRRPTLITILGIYVAANVGLALQGSFLALFLLRMLQSAGISGKLHHFRRFFVNFKGSFAIAYGVTGDVSTPAERGTFVGIVAFGSVSFRLCI